MTTLIDQLIEEDRKKPRRILVIGDGMTDVYVHGHLAECQDGCQKFVEESRVHCPGGAANAKRSLDHWFARSLCLYDAASCPVKTRFMVGNQIVARHDNDRNSSDFDDLRIDYKYALNDWQPEGVLISDYDKGLLTPEFLREVIDLCAERKIPCVADTKRHPDLYTGAVIKGNATWFEKYGPPDVQTGGSETPIVNGKFIDDSGSEWPQVNCINHVGAGDCFAAHLTLALVCGFSLKESAAIAHSAGRVYVQKRHNTPPKPQEIREDMVSVVGMGTH